MTRSFSSADVGKPVTTCGGDRVGTIASVESGCPFVRPASSLPTSVRERLGWTDPDGETYRLDPVAVGAVTDEAVHVRPEFWPSRS